jgi:hypothetical protein
MLGGGVQMEGVGRCLPETTPTFFREKSALYVEIIRNTFKIAHNLKVSAHIFSHLVINNENIWKCPIDCRFI